jgi:S-adenosylmethionine-diacylglycerol 3-amino-3-carboxypropyl transferase
MVELPTEDNPWLRHALTGSFGSSLPPYARPESFDAIRANLGALEFFHGSTTDAARVFGRAFDAFNLSDIFEYMDETGFRAAAGDLTALARPGARLCYWNMMVPRDLSEIAPETFSPLRDEAAALFARDRAFFYGAFHLDLASGNAAVSIPVSEGSEVESPSFAKDPAQ